MPNRSYLCFVDKPSLHWAKSRILAMDARAVPLLWLALFRPRDVLREDGPDEDSEPGLRFAPVAARDTALAQLDAAVPYLNRVFEDQGRLDDHAALFKKVFGRSRLRFVAIDLLEVAYTDDPEAYYQQLLAALTALEKERPPAAARTALLALAPLRLRKKFPPARCLLDDSRITRDDEWNMARLFGTEWEDPVPWEPQDENGDDWQPESTPLHKAVERRDLAEVKRLLRAGANPNAKNELGGTPLEYAVTRGLALVKALLGAGADPRGTGALGTAVIYTPEANRAAVVRMLLDHGADPNARTGSSPVLCYATGEVLRMLLDAGADVNARGDHTPLVSAVVGNRPEEVALLLRRGADANLKGKNRLSPMYFAKNLTKNEAIIALLRQHGAKG